MVLVPRSCSLKNLVDLDASQNKSMRSLETLQEGTRIRKQAAQCNKAGKYVKSFTALLHKIFLKKLL